MNADLDRLYNLLPAVYRLRDADQGWPLRGLLQVINEQVNVVEADLEQLYENWFIETCQNWVVPYIGDLIGYRPVHEAGEPGEISTAEGLLRNKTLIPRREVANTIRYRRRKGTVAVLELLSNAVGAWPARAVEFYKLLAATQNINSVHLRRSGPVDLRRGEALDRLSGPFDEFAHTVDVREPASHRSRGFYNIPSLGLFAWRLTAHKITKGPALCLEQVGAHAYSFSVLGNDTPLYAPAAPEAVPPRSPGEMDLAVPIRRRAFEKVIDTGDNVVRHASPQYYGDGKSVAIWVPNWPAPNSPQPVPAESIIPADLSRWSYRAPRDHIVVDPQLGRMVFPPRQTPPSGVLVSYYYGFSADIGGGEYERTLAQPSDFKIYYVGNGELFPRISDAVEQWAKDAPLNGVIEITDGGDYVDQIEIKLPENHSLQIRASSGKRPVLRLLDWRTSSPDALTILGEEGSWFILDGLLIGGRGIQVDGSLAGMIIRHSTIVPGWGLHCNCDPWRPAEPSLVLNDAPKCLRIEHSILGSIQVNREEVRKDPGRIILTDSILDATSFEEEALCAPDESIAFVTVQIIRSTVIGRLCLHQLELGENSIFYGIVTVARRQVGCVRFCYVTPGSRTPRRYNCQPDLVEAAASRDVRSEEDKRVRPRFTSRRYGQPGYCQLSDFCALEIRRGADDESEMGVFHNLFQPQRQANITARLEEFTSARMNAAVFPMS